MCNSSQSGRRTKTMKGCPSIEDLEQCEYDPQQTWCKTTQDSCKQQVGDMVDDGWAYCNNWYNADDNSGRAYEPQGIAAFPRGSIFTHRRSTRRPR